MRIAMVVPNPCAPDFRVQKQAETLASAGHEVCVFCTKGPELLNDEVRAGVRYQRLFWQPLPPLSALKQLARPVRFKRHQPAFDRKNKIEKMSAFDRLPVPSRLGRVIGARRAAVVRGWARNQIQTLYQPYLEARFARLFEPVMINFRADVVHAHDLLALPAAANVAQRTNARLIFDSHELEAHRNPPLTRARRRQVERLEARLLPRAEAVLTVGNRIADHLAANYNIARPLVLYNSPRLVDQQICSLPDIRLLAGAPGNALLLVYTGNIAPNRGLETGIKALGRLRRRGHDTLGGRPVCLVAMGRCPPALKLALIELAQQEGVQERLFILPPVSPELVSRQIATADAALIPIIPRALSYEYAMPNKLFEAIIAGLPVLGSDLAEMGAFLRQNGLGATFTPGDPDALADAIVKIFPNGENAVPTASTTLLKSLAWETQAEKLISLYSKLAMY